MYIAGNIWEGRDDVARDNNAAVAFKQGSNPAVPPGKPETGLVAMPFKTPAITTQPAEKAYELVLAGAGATLPKRDAVDERIITDVRNRTGRLVDAPSDVGGWPELKSAPAPADTDQDGIPDDWERSHRLDPADPRDGAAITPSGYSNLELYLNELAP